MYAQGTGHTDIGSQRTMNEDTLLVDNDNELYIVCDGMGGHACGERAAAIALEAAARSIASREQSIARARAGERPNTQLTDVVQQAVQDACRAVYDDATSPDGCPGMGTTLTMLLVAGAKAAMGHVGHSRLYLRRNGRVTQLSTDHTMAAELERRGAFSPQEIRKGPFTHSLTRSLGQQPSVEVETLVLDALPGDLFLLATDGLTDYVESSAKLAPFLNEPLETIPERLVAFANGAGGEDNITAVAVHIEVDALDSEEASQVREKIETRLQALEATPLFSDMSVPRLQRLLNISRTASYQVGEEVESEGAVCAHMSILLEGELELSRGGEVIGCVAPHTSFGEDCLLRARPARATLRVSSPTRVLMLPRDRFVALALRRPWFGVALFERLGKWVGAALERAWERSEVGSQKDNPEGRAVVDLF